MAGGYKYGETKHFNPRSPCGERLDGYTDYIKRKDFNPRSPCGERLVCCGRPCL